MSRRSEPEAVTAGDLQTVKDHQPASAPRRQSRADETSPANQPQAFGIAGAQRIEVVS
jgi:hypothetical protein